VCNFNLRSETTWTSIWSHMDLDFVHMGFGFERRWATMIFLEFCDYTLSRAPRPRITLLVAHTYVGLHSRGPNFCATKSVVDGTCPPGMCPLQVYMPSSYVSPPGIYALQVCVPSRYICPPGMCPLQVYMPSRHESPPGIYALQA
jgi:hypothetical protein